ncbi:hypothetical protein ABID13_003802 [Enterocloster citroniae]|uniref:Uncharacterized protein n=1 Tax=Enterocloster citroniae TaxID=358743 RepID=A0ABV2G1I0_9FIRM
MGLPSGGQQDLHCGGLGVSTVRGSDRGMDYE